jgi:membrane protein required for colicin V production
MAWVDLTLLAVLAVSVIVGLVRGFVFEVMSLAGWVVAWFGAQWAAPSVAPHVPVGTPGGPANLAVAFVLAFVAVLLAWALVARLAKMLVQATPLSLADRALGAGFGLVRGAVLLLAVATFVAYTPAVSSPQWRGSHAATLLMAGLQGLKPLLPPPMVGLLPA